MNSSKIIVLILIFISYTTSNEYDSLNDSEACSEDSDCADMPGTYCIQNRCVCTRNNCSSNDFQPVNKLRTFCRTDFDCLIPKSICVANQCVCNNDLIASTSGRDCLRPALGLYDFCVDNTQCGHLINNSVCYDSKCVCTTISRPINNSCVLRVDLNEVCTEDAECVAEFSACIDQKCGCLKRYVQFGSKRCLLSANGYLSPCEKDVQCKVSLGNLSVCSKNVCQCQEGSEYESKDNICKGSGEFVTNSIVCWVACVTVADRQEVMPVMILSVFFLILTL